MARWRVLYARTTVRGPRQTFGTMPPVDTLPNTGSGDRDDGGLGVIGATALGAAAAYLAGKMIQQEEEPVTDLPAE